MKHIVTILLMLAGLTASAQQLVNENVFKDITKLADVRQNRFTRPSPAGKTRKSGKPVVFYIGDSTMRNGTAGNGWNGEWGYGLFAQQWFDADRLVVENHALGGTSSRTYYNYEWPTVKAGIQEGDYVVISFGHNDGGSNWETKSVIGGTSATDTRVVTNNKGVEETVYSFGQYMRMFIDEVRALGAIPILCSRTPRGSFSNGQLGMDNNYRQWGKTVAEEKDVSYIDLEGVANPIYSAYGEWKTTQLYRNGTLHTSLLGAWHNAYCAAMAIAADTQNPLHQYLLDTTPPCLTVSRTAGKPYTFTVGGSDMSARLAFNSGRWCLVYNTLEKGDTVRFVFGDNELTSTTAGSEMGCLQSAGESQEMQQMSATSRWELVGSYGWYIHYFVNDCKEKGAVAVLVNQDDTTPETVATWNKQLANSHGAVLSWLDADGLPKTPEEPDDPKPDDSGKRILLQYDFESGTATDYWKRGNGYLVTPSFSGSTGVAASVKSASDRADYIQTDADFTGLKTYSVDLDLAISKDNKTAYFAVMSQSASEIANNWGWFWVTTSAEVHNPYLFELTIPSGTTAIVNEQIVEGQSERGSDGTWSFTAQNWYHLTLDVDIESTSVDYTISDKATGQKVLDGTYTLREGESALVKGIYERNNRYNYDPGTILVDNVVISTAETVNTGIVIVTPQRTDAAVYDLQGRRVTKTPKRGLYIVGGKKQLLK